MGHVPAPPALPARTGPRGMRPGRGEPFRVRKVLPRGPGCACMAEGVAAWAMAVLLLVVPWLVILVSAATTLNLVLVIAMLLVFSIGVMLLTASVLEA